jgi:hypothetical protein
MGSYSYEMGSYEMGSYEMGSYEMGSYEMGSYEMGSYELVVQALTYINEYPEFIDFVKDFDEEYGFMWSKDKRKFKIFNGINNDNHSPTSFALTLRVCQNIYKGELTLEQYKESCRLEDEQQLSQQLSQKEQTQKRIFH